MSPQKCRITELTTADDLLALKEEWSRLLADDTRATIFQTWEFQYHAWQMLADHVSLVLLAVRNEAGDLVGCVPLGVTEARLGPLAIRTLGFACARFADYSSILARPGEAREVVSAVGRWLYDNHERWDLIRLGGIRADSWLRVLQEELCAAVNGRCVTLEPTPAPYLSIQDDWTSFQDALSSSRAKKTRYEVRRLHRELGTVYREVQKEGELAVALESFFALHQRRWEADNYLGKFNTLRLQDNFARLVQALARKGQASICEIRDADGAAVASVCTFQFRGVTCYYQGGYDPEHGRLSPGNVLQALRIDSAIQGASREYDFLLGEEPYKMQWANEERQIGALQVGPPSLRGRMWLAWKRLRNRLSRVGALRALYMKTRGEA